MHAPARLEIGKEFAGYRIESVLGRGGMGVVYLAEQLSLGRKVAMKILAPEVADNVGFRSRFESESRAAAAIDHPNIIPLYEAGSSEGLLFISMRYVPGTDLRQLLDRSGPLPAERTLSIIGQMADALDAAHARGLVHRDVKPGNILVASGGGVERNDHCYLTDFGLTKNTASQSRAGLTGTGQFVGTIHYVAPEQIDGEPDGRADLYALACVAWECLTGEVPFDRESEVATLLAHLQEPPPPLRDKLPTAPPALEEVLHRALEKDPAARQATCCAFLAEARQAMASSPRSQPTRAAGSVPAPGALTRPAQPRPAAEPAPPAKAAAPPPLAPPPAPATPLGPGAFVDREPAREAPAARAGTPARDGGRKGLVAAGAAALVLAAAAAGLVLGGSGSGDEDGGGGADAAAGPPLPNSAAAAGVRVRFPADWTGDGAPVAMPGLSSDDGLSLRPTAGTGAAFVLGEVRRTAGLVPPDLRRALEAPAPRPQTVRVGELEAFRFDGLQVRDVPGRVTLYVVPGENRRTALACAIEPAGAALAEGCARIAATATSADGQVATLRPDADWAEGLSKALGALRDRRARALAALRAAGTSRRQAAPAAALAAEDERAGRAIAGLDAPAAVSAAAEAITATLADRAGAARDLAAAARRHDTSAYRRAARADREATEQLEAALAALQDYGYRTGTEAAR